MYLWVNDRNKVHQFRPKRFSDTDIIVFLKVETSYEELNLDYYFDISSLLLLLFDNHKKKKLIRCKIIRTCILSFFCLLIKLSSTNAARSLSHSLSVSHALTHSHFICYFYFWLFIVCINACKNFFKNHKIIVTKLYNQQRATSMFDIEKSYTASQQFFLINCFEAMT